MSNSLVPDQSRRFVGHDLDPKCLKRTSFDHSAHRRAGRSSVLESSCTKRFGLRSGPAYQWRTFYGFKMLDMPRSDLICVQNV